MQVPELEYLPTIPVFLRRAAQLHGETDFVVTPDRRMSYAEAERTTRRVAKVLVERGVGKGTRIGLMFGNGIEWIVTWLAAARVGAIVMPFATTYRPAELRKALKVGDVDTLVVPARLMGHDHLAFLEEAVPGLAAATTATGALRLPSTPFLRHVLVAADNDGAQSDRAWAESIDLGIGLGSDHGDISDELIEAIETDIHPADHTLVIFTSGTTSEPKGVIHTHGTWVRHAVNVAECNDARPNQRVMAGMPLFWIGGVSHTIGPLMHRGNTFISTEKFDPDAAVELMVRERVTDLYMWPGMAQRLLEHVRATGVDPALVPALSSPLPVSQARSMGMTETCAAYMCTGPRDHVIPSEYQGAFGLPVPFMQYRIVDLETGETLPEGVEGEICVRGYNLMAGMCKRERHETFDDDGWYHTGDKGYRRGPYLWLTGRAKDLIKTAGANVAPREVEVLLDAQPEVLMSVVVGLPDEERGEIVGAVLVPATGWSELDPWTVIARIAPDLSSYKVPRRTLVVAEPDMPYLPTGKPDRAELRDRLITAGVSAGRDTR